MLISPQQVTDTVYQTVQELLKRHGIEETEPMRQSVLLADSAFLGYRFTGKNVLVEWLAQNNVVLARNQNGETIFEHKMTTQNSSTEINSQNDDATLFAA